MRPTRLIKRIRFMATKFRTACRGRFEWWTTVWLCFVFVVHLATTHTRLGHKLHHREKDRAISSSSITSKRSEAASVCSRCFRRRMASPLLWNSALLVKYVASLIEYPPPHHAHVRNAHARRPHAHGAHELESTKMEEDLIKIVGTLENGVYVVVGAGGRQWRRLSEHLEERGWRGLLVDANARNVARQREAHAHAALLLACITYEPHLFTRGLWRPSGADLEGITAEMRQTQEEHVMLEEYVPDEEKPLGIVQNVTCFPLETIVLALQTSTVDLLVLDAPYLSDDLLQSLVRKRFKVKLIVLRMTKLVNGQDESKYLEMADEMGLVFLTWYGSYVLLADPTANVHVQMVQQ